MKALNPVRNNPNKSNINLISNLLNYELRTNKQNHCENIHLKILIPCIAAGAIIGKAGEAIAIIQKESGAKVKISKSYDFYPGTTERICLIMGTIDSITMVHDYIIEKMYEKPEQLIRQIIDGKDVIERHKQVKILVPNSTAGMIIGKSGCYIKEIKEKSGSFIQISQKAKEINLPERCVTIAGEIEQNRLAVTMILDKICEDPHSASCPGISYVDVVGPVASAYPTGSPYAIMCNNFNPTPAPVLPSSSVPSTSPVGLSNGNVMEYVTNPIQTMVNQNKSFTSSFPTIDFPYLDEDLEQENEGSFIALRIVRNILRLSGFSDSASYAISSAIETLCRYGLTNNCSLKSSPINSLSSQIKQSSFVNISLFDAPPLYGSHNNEDTSSTYPLDFLINSYLSNSTMKTNEFINDSSCQFSEEIFRNVEVTQEKYVSLGSIDGSLLMDIRLKTNTKMKISNESSSIDDGIYTIQVIGTDLDLVLKAVGMIIYHSQDINSFHSIGMEMVQ